MQKAALERAFPVKVVENNFREESQNFGLDFCLLYNRAVRKFENISIRLRKILFR
jgi:hypothetical protein